MTANAGYHVYNTGDVLTAAQVQYNLQNQTIMWFATTSARDTALTGVLVDGLCAYTPATGAMIYNGTTWIPYAPLTTKGDVYGFSTLPVRVPVGTNGQVLTADSTQASGLNWTGASGATSFTYRYQPGFTPTGFSSNGTTIWIAYGTAGNLASSTDSGVTWTNRTSGFGANAIYFVAYNGGTFVAVGGNGLISTSTDGITWTARTANVSTNALYHVAFLNSQWVAVGAGAAGGTGGVTTSPTGTTWTKRTTPGSTSATLYAVGYGNGYYVAVGTYNSTAAIASTDGITWVTTGLISGANTFTFVYYNGTYWIANTDTGNNTYFTNGLPTGAWTSSSVNRAFYSTNSATTSAFCYVSVYGEYIYYPVTINATSTPVNYLTAIYKSSTAYNATSGTAAYSGSPILVGSLSAGSLNGGVIPYVDPTGKIIIYLNSSIMTSF